MAKRKTATKKTESAVQTVPASDVEWVAIKVPFHKKPPEGSPRDLMVQAKLPTADLQKTWMAIFWGFVEVANADRPSYLPASEMSRTTAFHALLNLIREAVTEDE